MTTAQICHDFEEWDEYILENGGHPLQLWGWGAVKAAHGWRADRVFVKDGETILAAAQILTKKVPFPLQAFSYIPRGPVGEGASSKEVLDVLADFAKLTRKAIVLSIEPDTERLSLPLEWKRTQNTILPRETILLDISQPEEVMMEKVAKKTRQYIRKSSNEAITIKRIQDRHELETCLAIYKSTSDRAQFGIHPDSYYYDVFDKLGEFSPVFAAYVDNRMVAFLWLAISAETAFELYGGVTQEGQDLRVNYALKWYVISKTKKWGLTRYDFGGLLGDGEGVTTFKKGWSDHETHFIGTYDLPLSPLYIVWNKGLPTAKKAVRKLRSIRK